MARPCCCRKVKEKQNRLRADIDLRGAAYSGKRTSRAAAFDAASSGEDSAADRYLLMHAALAHILHTNAALLRTRQHEDLPSLYLAHG